MKKKITLLCMVTIILFGATNLWADSKLRISGNYVTPIGNAQIDQSFGIGLDYHFWGVFNVSLNMYNEVVLGAENIFNIQTIRPIGLFSGGLGMKIPMGGLNLLLDWQKYFTGTSADQGVFMLSDSYAIGVDFELNNNLSIQIKSRRLYNFSEQAINDSRLRIESMTETVDVLGIGASFRLF